MGGGGQFFDFMGGRSCYEGGHRAHGGPPAVPPLGKTLPVPTLTTNVAELPSFCSFPSFLFGSSAEESDSSVLSRFFVMSVIRLAYTILILFNFYLAGIM